MNKTEVKSVRASPKNYFDISFPEAGICRNAPRLRRPQGSGHRLGS